MVFSNELQEVFLDDVALVLGNVVDPAFLNLAANSEK
jgi:hypothetical protein